MRQRRRFRARRVNTALRLIELLGISQQDNAVGRRRSGKHICQRHLTRFVDKQHVNRIGHFGSRPKPNRACDDLCFIIGEGLLDTFVVVNDLYEVVFTTIIAIAFLQNFELLVPLQSGFASPFQQIADTL